MGNVNSKEEANRVFQTAKLTAHWLAMAGVPEAEEYSALLGIDKDRIAQFVPNYDVMRAFNPALHEIRYSSLNEAAKDSGCKNILDLACGYSPRGIKMAREGYTYVGLDIPVVIDEITPIVGKLGIPGLSYVAGDATNPDSLIRAVDGMEGPVFVITEGLLMYLNPVEFMTLSKAISTILHRNGGFWVTPDRMSGELYRGVIGAMFEQEKAKAILQAVISMYDNASGKGMHTKAKSSPEEYAGKMARVGMDYEPLRLMPDDVPLYIKSVLTEEQYSKLRAFTRSEVLVKMFPLEGQKPEAVTVGDFAVESMVKSGVLYISLSGRLDTLSSPELIDVINHAEGYHDFVIDCETLEYISSSGLRALLMLIKNTPKGKHTMLNVKEVIAEVLNVTGFVDMVSVEE